MTDAYARVMSDYVSSGRFKAELEELVGKLATKVEDDEDEDELQDLPTEVQALRELMQNFEVPELCGLRPGSFVTIPSQYDLDADGVREEEWFVDAHDIEVVMNSVEIFTESGSPYFLVGTYGVIEFNEDPHSYTVIAEGLEPFLRTVLAVEAVARGKKTAAEAEAVARTNLRSSQKSVSRRRPTGNPPPVSQALELPNFVTNTLEEAG